MEPNTNITHTQMLLVDFSMKMVSLSENKFCCRIKRNRCYEWILYNLGVIMRDKKDFDEAETLWRRALSESFLSSGGAAAGCAASTSLASASMPRGQRYLPSVAPSDIIGVSSAPESEMPAHPVESDKVLHSRSYTEQGATQGPIA